MEDSTLETIDQEQQKRPVFLTVLCILSFIGSGLAIVSPIPGLLFTDQAEAYFTLMESPLFPGGAVPSLEDFLFWTQISNVVGMLAGVIGLIGALLMWRLQKTGFYLYTFSWVVATGFGIFTTQMILAPLMGGLAYVAVGVNVVFMIAFLIMYGVNLKHLN